TVEAATEGDEFFAGHGVEFGLGRLPGFALLTRYVGALAVIGHDRAPIHTAAPMTATIPMIHIAMPSGAGPKPPRPLPPWLRS
ncbi:MAG: hypothetical protein QOC88_2571, partial [Mycobacterium sp.]|nr:hypothetical protein [Mycobacterium sp.]